MGGEERGGEGGDDVPPLLIISGYATANHVALSLAPWCTAAPQYHIPVYDAFGRGVCV